VDFINLRARLRQNTVLEKLGNLWLTRCWQWPGSGKWWGYHREMAELPIEEDGVEIDDPELLASIEAGCDEVERGEFGRPLEEILAEFRRNQPR
jgi:hypothetical protein